MFKLSKKITPIDYLKYKSYTYLIDIWLHHKKDDFMYYDVIHIIRKLLNKKLQPYDRINLLIRLSTLYFNIHQKSMSLFYISLARNLTTYHLDVCTHHTLIFLRYMMILNGISSTDEMFRVCLSSSPFPEIRNIESLLVGQKKLPMSTFGFYIDKYEIDECKNFALDYIKNGKRKVKKKILYRILE